MKGGDSGSIPESLHTYGGKEMQKFVAIGAALAVLAVSAIAETVTNRGEVIEVTTLTGSPDGDRTVVKDLSVPATQHNRQGILIVEFDFSVDGINPTAGDYEAFPLNDYGTLPKGAIVQPGYLEVVTALSAGYATNNVLALSVDATEATGFLDSSSYLKMAIPSSGLLKLSPTIISTSALSTAGRVHFNGAASTNALSAGRVFLYQPYILGHEQ